MSRRILQLVSLVCASAAVLPAQARNVFVSGASAPVLPFTADPFAPAAATVAAGPDVFQVLSTPNGSKFYFISRSTADTVVVTDANLQVIARRNLPTGAASAAMTPDGRYLLVAGGVAGA
ncbi:MAG: hypothetical protein SFV51_10015, partial [Bryobacteraceae bacterium]|nr:hypothetical protein [Bryobacteraceae bacterium]